MNDDEIPASKHSPNEKIHKPPYLINVFDNINGDSATAKRLGIHIYANTTNTNTYNDTEDSKEEEDIKEKIREIKKYVDIGITAINYFYYYYIIIITVDPQELPTFNVPDRKKKATKKTKAGKDIIIITITTIITIIMITIR
jgi:hypothetical protein